MYLNFGDHQQHTMMSSMERHLSEDITVAENYELEHDPE
jgi:hypothetical protein